MSTALVDKARDMIRAAGREEFYASKLTGELTDDRAFAIIRQLGVSVEDTSTVGDKPRTRSTAPGTPAMHSAAGVATTAQVNYAKALIASKLPVEVQSEWLTDLGDKPSKVKASAVIDKLKDRDDLVVVAGSEATSAQLNLIAKLETERGLAPHVGELSKSQASKLIEGLFQVKVPAKPVTPTVELADGFYRKGDTYIRVVHTRDGARQYASVWVNEAWDYQGKRPLHGLTAENLCTLEEAKAFGKLTEECGVCGRHLTDPDSIADGIGPICKAKGNFGG